jgi:hypothetical protein
VVVSREYTRVRRTRTTTDYYNDKTFF